MFRYSEALELLSVKSERTLRRWCTLFEQYGWNFKKDESSRRLFSEEDIELLQKLQEKSGSTKLEDAVRCLLEDRYESSRPAEIPVETLTILLDSMQDYLEGDLLKAQLYCSTPDHVQKELIGRWKNFRSEVECKAKEGYDLHNHLDQEASQYAENSLAVQSNILPC